MAATLPSKAKRGRTDDRFCHDRRDLADAVNRNSKRAAGQEQPSGQEAANGAGGGSERREKFAVALDRARNLAALHGAPDPGIHPRYHRGIQIALQKIDVMDAAPAAAGDVDAVGTLFAFEVSPARQIVFHRDRLPADFRVAFDTERLVVRDRDLLGDWKSTRL